jgi:hypothetical protein
MPQIELTRGFKATVDDVDYVWAKEFIWSSMIKNNRVMAIRSNKKQKGHTVVYLQNEIFQRQGIEIPKTHYARFRDGNSLNVTRSNLTLCPLAKKNYGARKLSEKTTSPYKGVYIDKHDNLYVASIKVQSKSIYLGSFKTEEEAVKTYKQAALQYHGAELTSDQTLRVPKLSQPDKPRKQIRRRNCTGYKGVAKDSGAYCVRFCANGTQIYLGRFKDPIEAAKVYDKKAFEVYGKEALLNFPEDHLT